MTLVRERCGVAGLLWSAALAAGGFEQVRDRLAAKASSRLCGEPLLYPDTWFHRVIVSSPKPAMASAGRRGRARSSPEEGEVEVMVEEGSAEKGPGVPGGGEASQGRGGGESQGGLQVEGAHREVVDGSGGQKDAGEVRGEGGDGPCRLLPGTTSAGEWNQVR